MARDMMELVLFAGHIINGLSAHILHLNKKAIAIIIDKIQQFVNPVRYLW